MQDPQDILYRFNDNSNHEASAEKKQKIISNLTIITNITFLTYTTNLTIITYITFLTCITNLTIITNITFLTYFTSLTFFIIRFVKP